MAIITTNAGFGNTGRDISIALTGPDGIVIQINQIISIEYRQVTLDITKTLLNANTILADLPRYWEGTIEFVRGDSNVDTEISEIEADWLSGGPADFTLGTLVCSITNTKAGNATLTFTDVSVKMEDGGMWKADDVTVCKLAFRAGKRMVGG